MFRKRRLTVTGPGTVGSNLDQSRSKKQRVTDVAKILLDVAKESADWFPPLKSALGGVIALIKHYEQFEDVKEKIKDLEPRLERFKQSITTTAIDGDPRETGRRKELTSALEGIEKRSQALLKKGSAVRFVDKGGDSAEVVKLIEQLQEAIAHYQISQQQAIYDKITDLTSSFNSLLKLHERSPLIKDKLDSIMARLDRLCSEDSDDALQDDNQHERWETLFNALRLIRDKGSALCDRVNIRGYEECQGDILAVSEIAEDIRDALLDYQTGQQRAVYDQNSRLIDAADLSVLNSCRRAPGAGYQHGDRRGCLRGTRETVLNEIESWTNDFHKSPVFWLNGLAGTGKSTIAQTVSEWAFADGLLGASFFCSRDFTDRSDLRFIFPTLAFQLAHKFPSFRSVPVPLLQSNPDVTHESLFNQMEKMIVEPLRSAGVSTVIVVDALDECKDEEPSSAILSVLGRFVERIPRVKFFITGRPEPRIKTGFRLPLLVDSTDVFVLHDVHPALIDNDIRLFLEHELSELARRRRLDGWPSDEHIDLLCHRAAGLFIYAVATVKFLDSKAQLPKRRLEVITGLPECTGHEGKTRFNSNMTLDSLYTSILETAFGEEDPEIYPRVRSTIGAVVLLTDPLPPSGIAELIGLDPEEVILFLTLAHSLLAIDEDFIQPVKPFHKSFPDFVTDPLRCADARFYISPGNLHFELAMDCLRVMNEGLDQNLLSLPDYALNSEVGDLETRIDNRISIALRYACKSWHSHLTKTVDGAIDVSHLRVFLEGKFLAWLEVLSVLGVARVAIVALEEVIPWLQVSRNQELLDIARDYFHFVTKFFEPISVSAPHIYHSALELSPISSIVRRLYYHRHHATFPRVVAGTADSWDQGIHLSKIPSHSSYIWSPCGRFIVIPDLKVVEIRDALSAELASTLTTPDTLSDCVLAYSPDGRSLASISHASLSGTLIIWDVQTGGVAKLIQYNAFWGNAIVWSLNGKIICITESEAGTRTVRVYNVVSSTTRSPGALKSSDKPHIWAHNESFRVMTAWLDGQIFTVEIFEVGSDLTKVESFYIKSWEADPHIESFSPTTYRISISLRDRLKILDVRNSECRLMKEGRSGSHCFSSDGNLFAASLQGNINVWKCYSDWFVPWREFPGFPPPRFSLQFSPTSSSILGYFDRFLQTRRLDGPHTGPLIGRLALLVVLSHRGTYTVTGNRESGAITIVNLLSQIPSQFVDIGTPIEGLALTGNVLLVFGFRTWMAWLLTEDGMVDGCFPGRRADRGDSIWTLETSIYSKVMVKDQTVIIEVKGGAFHVYHTGTGEVLDPIEMNAHRHYPRYNPLDMCSGSHYSNYRAADKEDTVPDDDWPAQIVSTKTEWVKDPRGIHRLWLPIEWRMYHAGWLHNITTLWLAHAGDGAVLVKF